MTDSTVDFWTQESVRHIVTYGGPGAGLFTIAGVYFWGDIAKTSCPQIIVSGTLCSPHLDLLGFHITSAEQFGLFLAISCLVICLAAIALTAITSKPTT